MAITINGSTNTLTGVAVGGLPDGIVDTDMLAANAVTAAKATGSVKGIQMLDFYRLSSSFSFTNGVHTIDSNWERADSDYPAFIGTGMTESSGIFTFPATGVYIIQFRSIMTNSAAASNMNGYIYTTTNNSSYNDASISLARNPSASGYVNHFQQFVWDVTDTSTHKCKFGVYTSGGTNTGIAYGHTERNATTVHFIKVGDT